jgi:hypothetical protein
MNIIMNIVITIYILIITFIDNSDFQSNQAIT